MGIEQLLDLVRKLPPEEKNLVRAELDGHSNSTESPQDILELLRSGPVMTDEQYQAWKENRKMFDQWRNL